jgi:hypothetical protein
VLMNRARRAKILDPNSLKIEGSWLYRRELVMQISLEVPEDIARQFAVTPEGVSQAALEALPSKGHAPAS